MKKLIACVALLVLCMTLFAACGSNDNSGLAAAKDYLKDTYKNASEVTPADFTRLGVVKIDGVTYTVEWTVSVTSGSADDVKVVADGNMVTIDVNEKAAADAVYNLTATIKDGNGKTETLTYNHKVPAFKELTWAEYMAAEAEAPVVVKGVVTGIIAKSKGNSYNCLYLNDADGGYYVYGMEADPVEAGIEVGMTVTVSGVKDIYSGTHEIKNGVAEITDSNKTPATAVDFTTAYTNAADLKAAALTGQQSMLVTVKGVEITGQDSASGYYKFKIGDKESYIRISSSVCPLTKDEQTAFKAAHTEHLGWTANVTGVICVYNDAFYLTPVSVDAIEYISLPVKSDAEMVAFEKDNISMPSNVTKDTVIELPATGVGYNQVAISWASDNACAVVADGKLTITMPDKDTTIKVTATLTSGTATDTVEFTIKVVVRAPSYEEIVEMLYALQAGESLEDTYRLFGVITSVDEGYSDQYKNITVTIQVGNMTDKLVKCYRLKGEGVENLKEGDAITVEGKLKNYNGTYELDSGCQLIGMGQIVDQTKLVNDLYALASGEKIPNSVLKGTITSIKDAYSEEYKNISVIIEVDGLTDKPVLCYRLKGVGAAELKVGDEIVVAGDLTNYNGTYEFTSGCMLAPVDAYSQVRILMAAYNLTAGESLVGNQILTGVISEVNTAYSADYKNVTVTIVVAGLENYPIECFRLKGEGADTIAVGDTITVTGELLHYVNKDGTTDKIEFNSGCTLDSVTKAVAAASLARGPRAAAPSDSKQTVDAAFALTGDETLTDATLTGVIKSIDTAYSSSYGNITVTIELEGTSGKKDLKCYRIEGDTGVDISGLKVTDTITVTGTISLYYDKPQFIAGSLVTAIVPGEGAAVVVPTDPKEIVDAAFALESGASLPYEATLTGKIVSIESGYSDQYKNISLTIEVEGTAGKKNLVCYRIKGDTDVDISGLAVGDTITVRGTIKNYDGTVEYDSTGRVTKIVKAVNPSTGDFPIGSVVAALVLSATALVVLKKKEN